jgi:hypothetical protein
MDGHITEFTAKGSDAAKSRPLTIVPGGTRIAAFQARDDHACIVIVGHDDGQVQEIFYASGGPIGISTLIASGTPLMDLGAFYTADDHYRHVILLDANGTVRELFYSPTQGRGLGVLGTDSPAHRVAAYATSDGWRHVILGGSDGHVRELAFNGTQRTDTHLTTTEPAQPRASVVGPRLDAPHTAISWDTSTAGLTYALAGNEAVRYAVSLDAGVWRSSAFTPWVSLADSPRYAQSLSVDPGDVGHVFVGERDGDAGDMTQVSLNQAGLWETMDLGKTWGYALDPLTLSHPRLPVGSGVDVCGSQAVPAIFALADGGALVATQCAVLRRHGRSGPFSPIAAFWNKGPFTGVAATTGGGRAWIWARTPTALLWSDNDGLTVHPVAMPPTAPDKTGAIRQIVTEPTEGVGFGFAAYGARVAFVARVTDSASPTQRVASLEFDALTNTWIVDPVAVGSGAGLGGRLFIKAEQAPSYTKETGQAFALLMSGAQTIFLGTPRGDPTAALSARGVDWRPVAETHWNPRGGDHYLLKGQSAIHSDLWDAHISDNPAGAVLLIGSDGGVFTSPVGHILSTSPSTSPQYTALNQGLMTQHIHTLAIVDPSYAHRSAVITAAVDNDAWWRSAAPFAGAERGWNHAGLGDANFTYADPGVTDAAVIWRHNTANGVVRHLTDANPGLDGDATVYPTTHFRSEHQFSAAPQMSGEVSSRRLEVVALARKGVTTPDTHAFICDGISPSPGAVDGASWGTVIVRTPDYAAHHEIRQPNPASDGWSLVGAAPPGAQRLWAAGPGPSRTYYVYAENEDNGLAAFYRQKGGQTFWDTLDGVSAPLLTSASSPYCAINGPLFPNPYDTSVVYALATDGVWRLSGGGFVHDDTLTGLVTRSGTYPVVANYKGGRWETAGDQAGLALHPSQATALSTLTDVRFDAADPDRTVAASAFGGVFFMDAKEGFWRDLTSLLPRPTTAVSGVAIAHDGVYVSYEGRGVWKVDWPELAPEATLFRSLPSTDGLAVLVRAITTRPRPAPFSPVVAGAVVKVVVSATKNEPSVVATVVTNTNGAVPFPPGVTGASLKGRIIHLTTEATAALGAASWSFQLN